MNSTAYHQFTQEEITLRDQLAIERTSLANERTFLSYVRTMIGFIAVGGTLIKLSTALWSLITGSMLVIAGVLFLMIGVVRYTQVAWKMHVIDKDQHTYILSPEKAMNMLGVLLQKLHVRN